MKKTALLICICFLCTAIFTPVAQAADKTKARMAIEQAKTNLDSLIKRLADSKDYQDDIISAQNYLKVAESEYKKNLHFLGWLKDEAEPTVRHYAAMADITVAIVTARLDKSDQIREKETLEGKIRALKARIKVFEDKNIEIERLKMETGSTKTALSKQVVALKAENAAMKEEMADLKHSREDMLSERKKLASDLNSLKSQKGVEFVQLQSQLTSATRTSSFLAGLSKLGILTRISAEGATLVIPRSDFFKISKRGIQLTAAAEKIAGDLAAVAVNYPEYRLDVKVFGYGKPLKNEDLKATDAMANRLKILLMEKGKMNPASLEASGAGTSPALFAKSTGDANRRVEFTFTYKVPAQ